MGDLQLGIKITADGKTADMEFNRISKNIADVGKSAKNVNAQLSSMAKVAQDAFAAMSIGISTKQLIETADAYTNMSSKLKLATTSAQEFAVAQKSLFSIAQDNKTALNETVGLYTRIAVGMREMGASQSQVLKVVDNVGKALKISGASTSEAASVTTQLSQALASGVLRGEEFNSVMENGPRIARAIADGLDVPIGKLRQMAQEGQLSSSAVIAALESQSAALDREAQTMQTTVGQAWQMIENAATAYVGEADQASGKSRELANELVNIAENFNQIADTAAPLFVTIVQGWTNVIAAVQQVKIALGDLDAYAQTYGVNQAISKEEWQARKQGNQPQKNQAELEKKAQQIVASTAKASKASKQAANDAEAAFKATIDANVKAAEDAAKLYGAQAKTSAMRFDNERKQAEEAARIAMKATESQQEKLQIAEELRKKQETLIAQETRLREEQLSKDEAALMARINGVNLEIEAAGKYNLKQSERIKLQTELQSLTSQQQAIPEERAQIQLESMAKLAEASKQYNDIRLDGETNVREQALRTLEVLSSNLEYAKEMASGLADAFGDVGGAIGGMTVALAEYAKQQATISIQAAEDIKKDPSRKLEIEQEAMLKSSRTQIKAYGDMTQAAQGFFKKGTKGYEAMGGAVKVFRAFEMAQSVMSAVKQMEQMGGMLNFFTASLEQMGIISSVNTTKEIAQSTAKAQAKAVEGAANQGTQGDPYSAFARVAAWVALMAGLGIMISGGSGSSRQGVSAEDLQKQQEDAFKASTATMLGSEEMSTSIRDALDLIANNSTNDLDYTKGMASDLNRLANAMDSAGAAVAKVFKIDTSKLNLGSTKTSNAPGFDPISGMIWGGTKTTRELVSQGIKLVSQSLWDIIEGALVKGKTFADVLVTKKSSTLFGLFGSTSQSLETIFGKLDSTIAQALSKSFKGIYTTIEKSADLLGMSGPGLTTLLNNLVIKMPRIPLSKDGKKNAENIAAALSAQADRWAEQINPQLKEFQRIDEGLYETMIRVSEGTARATGILETLGMTTISYNEIKEKEGDVAAEITRQAIMAQGDLSNGTRRYVEELTGSAEDIASAYGQILNITNLMRGAGFGTENIDRTMINAAGGLNKFQEALQSFRENFMTDEQRLSADTQELATAFGLLGFELPKSKDEFYQLALGIGQGTEESRKLFAQFIALNQRFSDLTDASKKLADAQAEAAQAAADAAKKAQDELISGLQKTVDSTLSDMKKAYGDLQKVQERFLNLGKNLRNYLSDLLGGSSAYTSPEERYRAARAEFERLRFLAGQGDEGALSSLTAAGKTFLDASREYNASSEQFQSDFAVVAKTIEEGAKYAEQQADIARSQLVIAESSYQELRTINDSVLTVNQGIANLSAAMASYAAAVSALLAAKTTGSASGGGGGGNPYYDPGAPSGSPLNPIPVPKAPVTISNNPTPVTFDSGGVPVFSPAPSVPTLNSAAEVDAYFASKPYTPPSTPDWLQNILNAQGYADGGLFSAGWAVVGERGAELVNFKRPGQVLTTDQTRDLLSGGDTSSKLDGIQAGISAGIKVDQAVGTALLNELQTLNERMAVIESASKLQGAAA